ncbi:hypothetical protein GGX14DRAFT_617618 [Mycena pura]|uniref:Uncharacterized protein n=1 Tax=Mycena pura TaxID=153505 RepID=A0AAD6VM50_9AGAR|nr:hypothetical protein GGX14DRAFT_617618 [Mycena pura]
MSSQMITLPEFDPNCWPRKSSKATMLIEEHAASKGLSGYLDGSITKPAVITAPAGTAAADTTPIFSTAPSHDELTYHDGVLWSLIISNIVDSIGLGVKRDGTAKECWDSVADDDLIGNIWNKVHTVRMMGGTVDDKEQKDILICSLPADLCRLGLQHALFSATDLDNVSALIKTVAINTKMPVLLQPLDDPHFHSACLPVPTFLLVPPYTSQYLQAATQTTRALPLSLSTSRRHPLISPIDPMVGLTAPGIHPHDFRACGLPPYDLWASGPISETPGHSVILWINPRSHSEVHRPSNALHSASRSSSGPLEPFALPSEVYRFGDSDIWQFGDSAIRSFGDSEVQWFRGLQPPLNNLQRNCGSLEFSLLSLISTPASALPITKNVPGFQTSYTRFGRCTRSCKAIKI